MRKTLALMGSFLLALLAIACKQEPVPDRVFLAGDSTAWLAGYYGPAWPYDEVHVNLGWRASNTRPTIDAAVADAARSPQVQVMAYGHNYVRTSWSPADRTEVRGHAEAVHDNACTVMVLPAYTGSDLRHALIIIAYREWATAFVAERPTHRVAVDWGLYQNTHPGSFPDGIHYEDRQTAEAFHATVDGGVERCRQLVG